MTSVRNNAIAVASAINVVPESHFTPSSEKGLLIVEWDGPDDPQNPRK